MFDKATYLIKERVAVLKLTDTYDIFDAATGAPLGVAQEQPPAWVQLLRLLINKQMLPTRVAVKPSVEAPPLLTIERGFTFLRSKIMILDAHQKPLGYFKSKVFSLGGGFFVFDMADNQVAEIKGDWKGWNFKFLGKDGQEMGTVTKKWAGIGKELFTSADNYVIAIGEKYAGNPALVALLLAAGLAIDIVFKER